MEHSINNCSAVCREFAGLGVSDPSNDEVRDCRCDRFVMAVLKALIIANHEKTISFINGKGKLLVQLP